MGPRTPLGGGSSPLAAAFSRAAGYCTEKSESHRAGLEAQRGVAGLGFCFPPTHPAKREKERETTYHTEYISLAERVTQRVPRGGFGEDSAPPAVSCGSWTKAQHQRGGYKRARREQKASALARAHLTEKPIGSCFRVISGKSRILLDRRKLDFRVRTTCFRCLGKVGDFDQWEIRTWELLAGEVDQLGGR